MPDQLSRSSDLGRQLLFEGFRPSSNGDPTAPLSKVEALRWSAGKGLLPLTQRLIVEDADVDAKMGDDDAPALHDAVYYEHYHVMYALVDAGASVSAVDGTGTTLLHFLATGNEGVETTEAIRFLVGKGLDVDRKDFEAHTALFTAAKWNYCGNMKVFHELGADVNAMDSQGLTPLHHAAAAGKLEAVQLLIDLGADIHKKSETGVSPLMSASSFPQCLERLLDAGADCHEMDDDSNSPLLYAARNNMPESISILFERGANINHQNGSGLTALSCAAFSGHLEPVRVLLKLKANHRLETDQGWQPLHYASYYGHLDIMKELLNVGAELEARVEAGNTPLHLAIMGAQQETTRLLVQSGADRTARNKDGSSVLHLAVDAVSRPIVRLLIQNGADMEARTKEGLTPLARAAHFGHAAVAALLLDHGADVNAATEESRAPLDLAARSGHIDTVRALLLYGPTINKKTVEGHSVLDDAGSNREAIRSIIEAAAADGRATTGSTLELVKEASKGNVGRVLRLLENGSVNATSVDGRRAISLAAENGFEEMTRVLLEIGADADLIDEMNGESPLWWASRYGHEPVVQQLISWGGGVSLDATGAVGQSALSVAAQMGHLGVVRLLVQAGSKLDTLAYGRTPLLLAAVGGHEDVVECLLQAGADINSLTPENETALSLAQEKEHESVAHLLRDRGGLLPDDLARRMVKGPDINDVPDNERKAVEDKIHDLQKAASGGRIAEMMRLIASGTPLDGLGDGNAPMISAVIAGRKAAVKTLIQHGASVRVKGHNGVPCLTFAAAWGHDSIIKLLYEHGARIHELDGRGQTALSVAASRGHESTVLFLLDLGARIESKDRQKMTPLLHAAAGGHVDLVRLLIDRGARLECVDEAGRTPLNTAVAYGHRTTVNLLIEAGASFRPDSDWNSEPLAFAAYGGYEAIVEVLIKAGADLNHQNDYLKTAMHCAVERGHGMVVKMLIRAGARLDMEDEFGRVPLTLAKEKCQESCVKLLSQLSLVLIHPSTQDSEPFCSSKDDYDSYHYQPIPQHGYIRVIELHPGKRGDIISIDLEDVNLMSQSKPRYEALSYEWKETRGTIPIQCGGTYILVTPNCKAAMESLRLEEASRSLWIDAVCINQEDHQERNAQVAIMADIYRSAVAVLMWLGPDGGPVSTGAAFQSMRDMGRVHGMLLKKPISNYFLMTSLRDHQEAKDLSQELMARPGVAGGFHDLYWRSYFTRAWIFQEAILAGSKGTVLCGRFQCPWREFKSAMLAYRSYTLKKNESLNLICQYDYFYHREARSVGIGGLIRAMAMFDSSDPRDKIFAILRLVRSQLKVAGQPVADYSLSTQEVFVKTATHLIESVDKGAECWDWRNRRNTKKVTGLPSWVPDFSQRDKGLDMYPFEDPEPQFDEMVEGRPSVTDAFSLVINICPVDRVAFKWTITAESSVFSIVVPVVKALSDQKRSFFGQYLSTTSPPDPESVGPEDSPENLYGRVLLTTILECGFGPEEEKEDREIFSYIVWKMSKSHDTASQAGDISESSVQEEGTQSWQVKSQASPDFDLEICQTMEERLRYDTDLILTEKGHFGLANKGSKPGLLIAVVGGAEHLCLLEEKSEGHEAWCEYVDLVYLRHLHGGFETLEGTTDNDVRRVEIR